MKKMGSLPTVSLFVALDTCVIAFPLIAQQGPKHEQPDGLRGQQSRSTNTPTNILVAEGDVLSSEPRLQTTLTLRMQQASLYQVLAAVNGSTRVHLIAQQGLGGVSLSLFYHAATLKDILESIAGMNNLQWFRKDKSTLYLLARYNPHIMDLFHPHTEAEAEVFRQGREFVSQVDALSDDVRSSLTDAQANGINFNNLPPSMQQNLRSMLAAHLQDQALNGRTSHMSASDMTNYRINLNSHGVSPLGGFTDYSVMIATPTETAQIGGDTLTFSRESQSLRISVFKNPNADDQIIPIKDALGMTSNNNQEDKEARQQARQSDIRLARKITLKMRNVTLGQALDELARTQQIDFVAMDSPFVSAEKSFAYQDVPLADVLDRLAVLYTLKQGSLDRPISWTRRKNGVFTVQYLPPVTLPPSGTLHDTEKSRFKNSTLPFMKH